MRGVARLDPASIIIFGLQAGGTYLLICHARKYYTRSRRQPRSVRPIKVSDARLYSRYKQITTALKEADIARSPQEPHEQYARRAAQELNEPAIARLGEIYLYARFRDAVPSDLVEEFDRLEPQALAATQSSRRLQATGYRHIRSRKEQQADLLTRREAPC